MLGQIALLDAVFSIDSVITAIGLADQVVIMVIAIVLSNPEMSVNGTVMESRVGSVSG